jgi:hypothetical protein
MDLPNCPSSQPSRDPSLRSNKIPKEVFGAYMPGEIIHHKTLTGDEKILYMQILSLAHLSGYCFAGNKWFEDFFKIHQTTVTKRIKNLQAAGVIRVEFIKDSKNNEIIERHIYPLKGVQADRLTGVQADRLTGVQADRLTGASGSTYYNNISNNNKINILSETSCSDDNTSDPKPLSGTERKFQKIYDYIVERIETLSEKGVIPAIRKLTGVRSALIKDRIKDEPSLLYWKELFDRIEDDSDIYSKENWFDFHFLFRAETKKGGNSREKVLSGHYDFLRDERVTESDVTDELPFDEAEGNQAYLELKEMVKDNITEDKMYDLVEVIEFVHKLGRADNHFLDGKSRRGYINYHDTFSRPWHKAYQFYIARYLETHPGMPLVVSMIKIGSECWQAFERHVVERFTFIQFNDELKDAQYRFDNKIY